MNHHAFVHPGTFMSPLMTRELKAKIEACPKHGWKRKALEKLVNETPLSYKPRALEVVDIGYGGVGKGHAECTKDGEMAVSAALLYWATHNRAYSELCLRILSAWSTTNKVWKGDNGLLEAAWSVCSMARASGHSEGRQGRVGVVHTNVP